MVHRARRSGAPLTAEITYRDAAGAHRAIWRSEGLPPPTRIGKAGDDTTAREALRRARGGEYLLHAGDYHNARQLLAAMGRRLARRPRASGESLADAFREERRRRRLEHDLLSRLLVTVEPDLTIPMRRAPDVRAALHEAWGEPPPATAVVPLREVLGMIGAHQWRVKGIPVPALGGRIHPSYGVFAPIRGEHVNLVAAELAERPAAGKRAFDIGTGTGVLAILLALRGARVVATDHEPRAVACARENAERFGVQGCVEVIEADLFPAGRADLVVMNPPWIPAEPLGRLDRAVYDPGGRLLERFLSGLVERLAPEGEGWLIVSDLAERLGLRPRRYLPEAFARAGLTVSRVRSAPAAHPRAHDARDPLHDARCGETTTLYCIA